MSGLTSENESAQENAIEEKSMVTLNNGKVIDALGPFAQKNWVNKSYENPESH